MNIGGVYGKAKEQETDVLRGWKRLDLPFKVEYPHDRGGLGLGSGGCIKSASQEEELECTGPRSLNEFLVEARGISTCGCGNSAPDDFKN